MLSNLMYALEHYRAYQDDDGRPRVSCVGWVHHREGFVGTPNEALSLSLAIPGARGVTLAIEDRSIESRDVAAMIGSEAGRSRFRLDAPIERTGLALQQSVLLIGTPQGDTMSLDVGAKLEGDLGDPDRDAREGALFMRFEGLGINCEFGLVQRKVGFNRMGLLRLAGSYSNKVLAEAIRNGFEGFGTPEDLDMRLRGTEWMAFSRRYGFDLHTYRHHPEHSEAKIRADESTKLTFLAGLLLDTIELGERILVRRATSEDDQADREDLAEAIRSRGPATLLWVTNPQEGQAHGTIESRPDGSYVGYHARLAPTRRPTEFDRSAWASFLEAADQAIAKDRGVERRAELVSAA